MSYNSHNYWSSPNRRDNDNPFEKYKSQRNAGTDLPGFRARRSRHSRSRALKALGVLVLLGVLVIVWQGSTGGAFYGYGLGSLDSSGEHITGEDTGSIKHLLAEGEAAKRVSLAGSGNIQIGKEKASLVMLVRYDIFSFVTNIIPFCSWLGIS